MAWSQKQFRVGLNVCQHLQILPFQIESDFVIMYAYACEASMCLCV